MWVQVSWGEGRDALFSAHGLVHPGQHLGDPGVDSIVIWACASHSPADQTSQKPPATGFLAGQRTSRITLEKWKGKWGNGKSIVSCCFVWHFQTHGEEGSRCNLTGYLEGWETEEFLAIDSNEGTHRLMCVTSAREAEGVKD